MVKFQILTAGCILIYLVAPPMMEGQLCASRVIFNGPFIRLYRDGGECTWYRTCQEDICSTCTNLTAGACPMEQCLAYLPDQQAYGNRCGINACDDVAQCMKCIVNCSLSEIGVVLIPNFRLFYNNRVRYYYQTQY